MFNIIMLANASKQIITIDNEYLAYTNKAKILGLHFKPRNFLQEQVGANNKMPIMN